MARAMATATAMATTAAAANFHAKTGQALLTMQYMIRALFLNVDSFVVKQPSYLSNHSAIIAWLNINANLPVSNYT